MQSARRYFGSASEIRSEVLPQLQASNRASKAQEARNKLRQRQRREFRARLLAASKEVPRITRELENYARSLHLQSESDIGDAQQKLELYRERVAEMRLSGAPKNLGPLETVYLDYRDSVKSANSLLAGIAESLDRGIERINPAKPRELLERQIARNAGQIHRRIQAWKRSIDALQKNEFDRIRALVSERNKIFHAEAPPLLARFDRGEISFPETARLLDRLRQALDEENEEIFPPYISALESLKESIDLEHLATFGMDEVADLRVELERLNSLAQLGIAVEIVGHELQAYDDIIAAGPKWPP